MVRFGLSRARRNISAKGVTAASQALTESRRNAPSPGEVLFEIGLILALHLAFAVAVLLTLDAYGVT
jgi:hypothetical protein